MRAGALHLVVVAGVLAGCTLIEPPDYGVAPDACRFAAVPLAWAGHGDPADFGLLRNGEEPRAIGDIYVEAERPPGVQDEPPSSFCVFAPRHVYVFAVPAGWRPP